MNERTVVIIIFIGFIVFAIGVFYIGGLISDFNDEYREERKNVWVEKDPDRLSCEILEKTLIDDYKWTTPVDTRIKDAIYDKWLGLDCENPKSENWKGKDWKYEPTKEDRIKIIKEIGN